MAASALALLSAAAAATLSPSLLTLFFALRGKRRIFWRDGETSPNAHDAYGVISLSTNRDMDLLDLDNVSSATSCLKKWDSFREYKRLPQAADGRNCRMDI